MKVKSVFRPSCWLPGPHWQTIWASRFRSLPSPDTKKEQIELDDGDFINLYWLISGLEIIVIIVQAYVFTLLSAVFIGMAINVHH